MQSDIWPVEKYRLFVLSVIDRDVECAAGGNDQLLQSPVPVGASRFPARDIVQVVNSPDGEWNILKAGHGCNISRPVMYTGEMDDITVVNRGSFKHFWRF